MFCACSLHLSFPYINPFWDGQSFIRMVDYRTLAIAFLFIDFFVEIVSDSFKNVLKRGYFDEFIATCRHVILVELIVTFYLFTTQTGSFYSRLSYYIMVPFYIVTDYAARVIWKKILQKIGFNSAKKSLLIIAPEKILRETLRIVSADRRGYAKVTAVSLDTDLKGKNICGIPIVADRDGIIEYACGEWVDEVFIPPCAESEYPNELVGVFLEMGIAVHTGIAKSGFFPTGCQQVEKIGVYTVITTSMNYAESSKLLVKRLMDIAGGLVGCLITLLITIIVGPMIYISSPGPIFFAQERIGRNGRKFKMYKFRSMYMDAEERKKELMNQNKISDGLMFKMDFDPRIIGNKILPDGTRKTGIGQFIRKTSLDEFPQFINILLGDMSLVGTRPPTVDEWELYEPHHSPNYDPMVVVACSSAEYGQTLNELENPYVLETAELKPLHPYGVSKVGQDLLSFQYFMNDHIRCIRVRIFNSTGTRKTNDVTSDFTKRAVLAERSGIYRLRVIVRFISVSYHENKISEAKSYFSSSVYACVLLSVVILAVSFLMIWKLEYLLNIPDQLVVSVKILFLVVFLNFVVNTCTSCILKTYGDTILYNCCWNVVLFDCTKSI